MATADAVRKYAPAIHCVEQHEGADRKARNREQSIELGKTTWNPSHSRAYVRHQQ